MNRRFLALLGSALLVSALVPASVAAKAPADQFTKGGNFIVQMSDPPVVAYKGGTKGLKATAPAAGQKIDPLSAKVVELRRATSRASRPPRSRPPAARSSTTTSTPTTASRRR